MIQGVLGYLVLQIHELFLLKASNIVSCILSDLVLQYPNNGEYKDNLPLPKCIFFCRPTEYREEMLNFKYQGLSSGICNQITKLYCLPYVARNIGGNEGLNVYKIMR